MGNNLDLVAATRPEAEGVEYRDNKADAIHPLIVNVAKVALRQPQCILSNSASSDRKREGV